jgi:hypothetical protein
MAKRKPVRSKRTSASKPRRRAGTKSPKGARKPAKRPAARAPKWYAYCVIKQPPHEYSPIYGYLPWSGPHRASRALADADARAHNANPGHQALVFQAKPKATGKKGS